MTTKDVSNPSLDHAAMSPYWSKVSSILGGTTAMRAAGKTYLPKFANESDEDYAFRLANSKFTNIFGDIIESLSSKPFAREVGLSGETNPPWAVDYIEDVDSKGNHIHVFASDLFCAGISDAMSWIMVDYTKDVPDGATKADEQAIGARPYWVHIKAANILAARSKIVNGKEQFTHVRIKEDTTEVDGYEETIVEQVRELNLLNPESDAPTVEWSLHRKVEKANKATAWEKVDEGTLTIGVIPLVPFITGRRMGGTWQIKPVLEGAADLQIELYQGESGLKNAKNHTAFPMLAGNGVQPPLDENGDAQPIRVGPKAVLYAPPNSEGDHGEWNFIEPSSESLRFLSEDNKETIKELRELGRQPLTAQTGNLTVVTTTFAAEKANSVIQAWTFNLKDALENAFAYTAMWLKAEDGDQIDVYVDTDFDINMADESGPTTLTSARQNGDLSQRTYWSELKRRGMLGPDFDPDQEESALDEELPGIDEDELMRAAGQEPVNDNDDDDDDVDKDDQSAMIVNDLLAGIRETINGG